MCSSRKYPYLPHGSDFFSKNPYNFYKASHISLNFRVLQKTPNPRKFQSLLWGEYGYFLDVQRKN